MRYYLEYIFVPDSVFECEWATNLLSGKLVDRWVGPDGFPRLDELKEGKFFNSGGNWLDERVERT